MKTKLVLAILGVALVAAALVGVTAAQFAGIQNRTTTIPTQTAGPYTNGATPSYGYGCYGYGYGAQGQYLYGAGMMGGAGFGMMGRGW